MEKHCFFGSYPQGANGEVEPMSLPGRGCCPALAGDYGPAGRICWQTAALKPGLRFFM